VQWVYLSLVFVLTRSFCLSFSEFFSFFGRLPQLFAQRYASEFVQSVEFLDARLTIGMLRFFSLILSRESIKDPG
jgi:hypothetical protein